PSPLPGRRDMSSVTSIHDLAPGAVVCIGDGVFAGMEGVVEEGYPWRWQVRLTLTLFGRPVRVEIDGWQLDRAGRRAEADWRARCNQRVVLGALSRRASDRKLRLLACACRRARVGRVRDPPRRAVEVAERVADDEAMEGYMAAARAALGPPPPGHPPR